MRTSPAVALVVACLTIFAVPAAASPVGAGEMTSQRIPAGSSAEVTLPAVADSRLVPPRPGPGQSQKAFTLPQPDAGTGTSTATRAPVPAPGADAPAAKAEPPSVAVPPPGREPQPTPAPAPKLVPEPEASTPAAGRVAEPTPAASAIAPTGQSPTTASPARPAADEVDPRVVQPDAAPAPPTSSDEANATGAPHSAPATPTGPVSPLPSGSPPVGIGYDISWPQCATPLPSGQAFGVVGVNGGLANTTNPCLDSQLAWATQSSGITEQPKVALYVNTANPSAAAADWWPRSNTYPVWSDSTVTNPYGQCMGADSPACSYLYGYAKAYDNATLRGVPDPAGYFWWLDVETDNSWGPDPVANRAALEGMAHYYLDVLGVQGLGIYSTGSQWTQIVGGIGPVSSGTTLRRPSNLNGLPSWLAGANTLAGAKANCADPALTGGAVTLTQYVMNDLDHNYVCA